MTFWEFVEHDASRPVPPAHELGGSLRELHAALADFPGELAQLSDVREWLDRLLAELHPSPRLTAHDRDLLRSQLEELTPSVFESSLSAQAIHGDASISNLLRTENGLIWNDLEDSCIGPVQWDVAGLIAAARARGGSEAFVADFLRAYGGRDLDGLDDFIAAHRLYTTVWVAFDAQRRSQTPTNADAASLPTDVPLANAQRLIFDSKGGHDASNASLRRRRHPDRDGSRRRPE
jgi:Ser/Thr protein kinase RdoA (MazF antagonist)